jgi:hypothetical protein
MSRAVHRPTAIREILNNVCRSVQWGGGVGVPAEERMDAALEALRIELTTEGVVVEASIDRELRLCVKIRASRWSTELEQGLLRALEGTDSPVARLLIADWSEICAACQAASDTGKPAIYPPADR